MHWCLKQQDPGAEFITRFDDAPSRRLCHFGELLAIATGFCADYYPFRNELNRVTSSRFEITWLVATPRVQQALASNREAVVCNLSQQPGIRIVNDGWRAFNLAIRASQIAFEIPADWTALQREDLMQAQKWRVITDQLFKHYLGTDEGKYLVTGVGEKDGKKYLLANRVEAGLLERLAS